MRGFKFKETEFGPAIKRQCIWKTNNFIKVSIVQIYNKELNIFHSYSRNKDEYEVAVMDCECNILECRDGEPMIVGNLSLKEVNEFIDKLETED